MLLLFKITIDIYCFTIFTELKPSSSYGNVLGPRPKGCVIQFPPREAQLNEIH